MLTLCGGFKLQGVFPLLSKAVEHLGHVECLQKLQGEIERQSCDDHMITDDIIDSLFEWILTRTSFHNLSS